MYLYKHKYTEREPPRVPKEGPSRRRDFKLLFVSPLLVFLSAGFFGKAIEREKRELLRTMMNNAGAFRFRKPPLFIPTEANERRAVEYGGEMTKNLWRPMDR